MDPFAFIRCLFLSEGIGFCFSYNKNQIFWHLDQSNLLAIPEKKEEEFGIAWLTH